MRKALEHSKAKSKFSKTYKFGYRGIWFNLMLLMLVFVSSYLLYDRAIAVIKEQQTDWLLGIILSIAVLLEIYLYPIKLRYIFARHHYENRKKLKTLAFFLLIPGAIISFIATGIIAMSFGFDPSDSATTAGILGWIFMIRFLYLWLTSPITSHKVLKIEPSSHQALKVDFGIAFFSSIYYVCIWQAMTLSNFNLDGFKGETQDVIFEIIGFSFMVLFYILPIRALYFMEEWQGKPGIAGIFAIVLSLILLITETLFQFLSPAILNGMN